MSITVYGIKNCNSMKKAFDFLQACDVAYEFFDYKKQVVSQTTFEEWVAVFGLDKVINKQGTTYRKLDDTAKALLASADVGAIYQLVADNQSIIKRPIIAGTHLGKEVALIGYVDQAMQHTFS